MTIISPAYSADQKPMTLASKNGLHLTQKHLELAIDIERALELDPNSHYSQAKLDEIKTMLIQEFNADPQETISSHQRSHQPLSQHNQLKPSHNLLE